MKQLISAILFIFFLTGCGPSQGSLPTSPPPSTSTLTPTVSPPPTATNTPQPTSTITLTPDLLSTYLKLVPSIPEGFEWKILPEKRLAVVQPDGWFFKLEDRTDLNLEGIYITKENIDETGRFSTGLTVFVFSEFESDEEAEDFALALLQQHIKMDTTKEILKAWDSQAGPTTIHHLRIKAEYPYETDQNRNKIVHYSAIMINKTVYWSIFESPEPLWEETIEEFGLLMDYIIVFGN